MSDTGVNTVERAFQLAKAGACRSIDDIRRCLSAEGHDNVFGHLNGMMIKRQLSEALAARGVVTSTEQDED